MGERSKSFCGSTAGRVCFTALLMATLVSAAHGQSSYANAAECTLDASGHCVNSSGAKTPSATHKAPSANDTTAAKFKALHDGLRANQQLIQNSGDALLSILQSSDDTNGQSDNSDDVDNVGGSAWDSLGRLDGGAWENLGRNPANTTPAVDYAALAAAKEAARRAQINADAARIFQDSQSDFAGANGNSSADSVPIASSAVNSLLGSSAPSTASNSAINNLLGDSASPSAANAVAGLLDINKVSDSASAFALPAPENPQMNAALEETEDNPDSTDGASITQTLQSAGKQVTDKLSGLVSSGKSLLSDLSNDPAVYWAVNQGWQGTTAPLPTASDSPETAANLVHGQAIVGFGDILAGAELGPAGLAKGLRSYGSKLVNQIGADLGLATDTVLDQGPNGDQGQNGQP